jgi:poly(3-hydroxybutyrate) depolymerase
MVADHQGGQHQRGINSGKRAKFPPWEFWRGLNGCATQTAKQLPHRTAADPTRIRLIEWGGCAGGIRLRLYRVGGGGHRVPAFAPSDAETTKQLGRRSRDIEAADEIRAFFTDAARPP